MVLHVCLYKEGKLRNSALPVYAPSHEGRLAFTFQLTFHIYLYKCISDPKVRTQFAFHKLLIILFEICRNK